MASIKKYDTAKGTRWRVDYVKPDGKNTSKRGFLRKTDAQAWAENNAVSIRTGTWTNPTLGRATINDLWQTWYDSQLHLKPSSLRVIESSWRTHVQPQWGTYHTDTIAPSETQAWVNKLAKTRSATIVHRALGILRSILDDAIRDHRITENPCNGIRLPSRSRKKDTTLTRKQVELLINNCQRYKSLVAFLAYTGARWGEAVALTVGDIDTGTSRALINKSASTVSGRVVVGETKTSQTRAIAIPAPAMKLLIPELRDKLPTALVWTNASGVYITSPSRRSWWHSAVDRCREDDEDFPEVTPHDLRHAAASMLISMGASVVVVQRQLGHASAKMTLDRYSHLFDADLDEILSAYSVKTPSKMQK